jgi:hypothetical protein
MIENDWAEANSESPIFIDRDSEVFPLILSYMRSQKIVIDDSMQSSTVEKLLIEADFYQLIELSSILKLEISIRQKKNRVSQEVYKAISCHDLDDFLSRGWQFVSAFKGDSIYACIKSNKKVPATIDRSQCTSCGERLEWMQFKDHCILTQPTIAVIKKLDKDIGVQVDPENLFDASFG